MTPTAADPEQSTRALRIALLGNPNTGKTTLFNRLTGLRHKTSNFPGTTQESRTAVVDLPSGFAAQLIDLPGIYSLEIDQPEAAICREVLAGTIAPKGETEAEPDALLVVLDATNLARNLVFLAETARRRLPTIIAINMSSAFHTIHHALPLMRKQGWGRIINIASAHGLVASPYKSAYVTAKHGILGLTKTVALECAENNITVNAICPGYVKTPLVEGQIADTAKARGISEEEVVNDVLLKAQWTKKFVSVEQLSGLALFLCSDAAENMTGGHISVDGGWTAA